MAGLVGIVTLARPRADGARPDALAMLAAMPHRYAGTPTHVEREGVSLAFARTHVEQLELDTRPPFGEAIGCVDGTLAPVTEARVPEGPQLLPWLAARHGGFALMWLDADGRRLRVARDRFGLKPLSWARSDGVLLVASELKALYAAGLPRRLAHGALVEYLVNGMPIAGRTLDPGVRAVDPGTLLEIDVASGATTVRRFAEAHAALDARASERFARRSEPESADDLEARLVEAVEACLAPEVKSGVFLSGGVDSSLVAALGRSVTPDLVACTVDVRQPEGISEVAFARRAAAHVGVPLLEYAFDRDVFRRDLVPTIVAMECPLIVENAVALFGAARLLREQGIELVIDGEGADLLFAGSTDLFKWQLVRHSVSSKSRLLGAWLDRFVEMIARGMRRVGLDASVGGGQGLHIALAGGGFDKQHNLARLRAALAHVPAGPVREIECALLDEFLIEFPALIQRLMQTSVAHSVEVRLPFLHPRVLELALNLPFGQRVRVPRFGLRPVTKSLLKQVAERHVPHDLLYRPKLGFAIPGGDFVGRLPPTWFADGALAHRLQLPAAAVQAWYESPQAGRDRFFYATSEIWARIYLEGLAPKVVQDEYLSANA